MKNLNKISLVLFPYLLTLGAFHFFDIQRNFLGSIIGLFALLAWVVAVGHFFKSINELNS